VAREPSYSAATIRLSQPKQVRFAVSRELRLHFARLSCGTLRLCSPQALMHTHSRTRFHATGARRSGPNTFYACFAGGQRAVEQPEHATLSRLLEHTGNGRVKEVR